MKPIFSFPRKVPTVLQMERMECGAAALSMILAYYGRWEPLEILRSACGVSRDGSKASNIAKAAEHYGLKVKAFTKEISELQNTPLPGILFWNFNHFVVLTDIINDEFYINDPASGPRIVPKKEFDEAFTGVILLFETTDQFQPCGRKPSVYRGLIERLAGSKNEFLFLMSMGLLLVLPGVLMTGLNRIFVDYYLVQQYDTWLLPLLIGLFLASAFQIFATWLRSQMLLMIQSKIAIASSTRFVWKTLKLPLHFFAQRFPGEISSRLLLNDTIADIITGPLAGIVLNFITILFYGIVLLYYDVSLTLIGVSAGLLNLVFLHIINKKLAVHNAQIQIDTGKHYSRTIHGIGMLETFRSSGTEGILFQRLVGSKTNLTNTTQQLALKRRLIGLTPQILNSLISLLILIIGALKVMHGELTIGTLLAIQTLMGMFLAPFGALIGISATIESAIGSILRVDDLLNHKEDIEFNAPEEGSTEQKPLHILQGDISIRDVAYGYSPLEPPFLKGITITIPAGNRIALVGAVGSGKSTLGKLLLGMMSPWKGELYFGEHRRLEIPRESFRTSVSYVEQHTSMFQDTVRNNLTLWDTSIPESSMIQAAKDAQMHDVIASRQSGYDSLVLEGGKNFSGGELQRLAIARSLVGDPTILVLDEATSALDANNEVEILNNIRHRGCTCVLITHRLSAIRDCDEIIVLDHGTIVQRGPHYQLVKQGGLYQQLVLQNG